jgi:hypothetical protein
MTREVGNSGYGLTSNGIVAADSTQKRLHIRANVVNNNSTTSDAGEDLTFIGTALRNQLCDMMRPTLDFGNYQSGQRR